MATKGSKLNSVLNFKCPKCQEGDLYPTKILSFRGWFKMNEKCEYCGQKYTLEPGFYWGAMYIGYIVSSFLIFAFFALFFFVFDITVGYAFIMTLALIVFLYAFIFRISRSIWINFYVHYNPESIKAH